MSKTTTSRYLKAVAFTAGFFVALWLLSHLLTLVGGCTAGTFVYGEAVTCARLPDIPGQIAREIQMWTYMAASLGWKLIFLALLAPLPFIIWRDRRAKTTANGEN